MAGACISPIPFTRPGTSSFIRKALKVGWPSWTSQPKVGSNSIRTSSCNSTDYGLTRYIWKVAMLLPIPTATLEATSSGRHILVVDGFVFPRSISRHQPWHGLVVCRGSWNAGTFAKSRLVGSPAFGLGASPCHSRGHPVGYCRGMGGARLRASYSRCRGTRGNGHLSAIPPPPPPVGRYADGDCWSDHLVVSNGVRSRRWVDGVASVHQDDNPGSSGQLPCSWLCIHHRSDGRTPGQFGPQQRLLAGNCRSGLDCI